MRELLFLNCIYLYQSLFIILKLTTISIISYKCSHLILIIYRFPPIIVSPAILPTFIISNYPLQ